MHLTCAAEMQPHPLRGLIQTPQSKDGTQTVAALDKTAIARAIKGVPLNGTVPVVYLCTNSSHTTITNTRPRTRATTAATPC